jgi:glucose-fructose oxidoreductase
MNPHTSIPRRSFLRGLTVGGLALSSLNITNRLLAQGDNAGGRKLGVALCGLGGYSRGQLGPALRETKQCRLAGVVTGSREKGEQWSRDYGFSDKAIYGYDTMQRMADNPEIDIVYVVTPNSIHAENVIAAARAGKHVICEKPMANTVAECDAMLAACRAAGVKLSMGYRLHFDPNHREMIRLAREKDFGAFDRMDSLRSFNLGLRDGKKPWRATRALAGGGPLMDLGVYVVQAACMAKEEAMPVAVTAMELPKKRPEFFTDVEETLQFQMHFADGAVCDAITSYEQTGNTFRAAGPNGWIRLEPAFSYRGIKTTTSRGLIEFPTINQQAVQMDDFAACILAGRESIIPGEMGRRDMVIIEAIYEAARTGKRVELSKA